MSTENDCECAESNSGASPAPPKALDSETNEGGKEDAPAESTAQKLLKSMYFWVLSRL